MTSARCPGQRVVKVYDSKVAVDTDNRPVVSDGLLKQLQNIYGADFSVTVPDITQQLNSTDCGVFAIAAATDLCFGRAPENRRYVTNSKLLRQDLNTCFTLRKMTPFPSASF